MGKTTSERGSAVAPRVDTEGVPVAPFLRYPDLPPAAVRAAASMVRGILYNLGDEPLTDEKEALIAKNTALHVLNAAAGWHDTPGPARTRDILAAEYGPGPKSQVRRTPPPRSATGNTRSDSGALTQDSPPLDSQREET